ncbi:MAG: hypothetical protein NTW19_11600 [Planctomycetota bacterium]|nr:hypothetical protein [Planctomycetota bacterium]
MNLEPAHTVLKPIALWFPNAHTVSAMGKFNNWSTSATLLRALGNELWEMSLPPTIKVQELCFFVMRTGEMFGHVHRYELANATAGASNAARPAVRRRGSQW